MWAASGGRAEVRLGPRLWGPDGELVVAGWLFVVAGWLFVVAGWLWAVDAWPPELGDQEPGWVRFPDVTVRRRGADRAGRSPTAVRPVPSLR